MSNSSQTLFLFLRGINVGGHHKVPMAELRSLLEKLGFSNVQTLLNSGNVIFESEEQNEAELEKHLSEELEKKFDFPIPVLVKNPDDLRKVLETNPFKNIEVTKDMRLYMSLLKSVPEDAPQLPWKSEDDSFEILLLKNKTVCSVLDVSKIKTPDAMKVVEKFYGKDITTRNVNTVNKMLAKI